jgi:hypothetical protein
MVCFSGHVADTVGMATQEPNSGAAMVWVQARMG